MASRLPIVLSVVLMTLTASGVDAAGPDRTGWAALVIDVQPCFVTGGALAVAGADAAYVSDVQRATKWLYQKGFLVLGSRDYHPEDHISFASNHPGHDPFEEITLPDGRVQVLWPDHCVQTAGDSRELVDNNLFLELVKKGQNPMFDSYSAFRDDGGADTELHTILQAKGVTHLVVYGIATDYCVMASVMDALDLGYSVTVVEGLLRGVAPETSAAAIADMEAAGAVFVPSVKALN
ncbi:MAG: bifunctional nicotinamidase/pyrazinamidase [Deferrisomatales bacterium]|nr:bifunctional nicotinamidase/pyrazinamidase [Deferrisomatales bacterium]